MLIVLLPILFSCQKYQSQPFDDYEKTLRNSSTEETKGITIDNQWRNRDSLSYLRFNNINNIYLQSLETIPTWIGSFKNLKFLSTTTENSTFKTLPSSIKKLQNLESLNLSRTKLNFIPVELFEFKKLKALDLSYSEINSLSNDIRKLNKLESLSLENSRISSLPQSICELVFLKYLIINNTDLDSIPKCLGNLVNLKIIFISNTFVTEFPIEILNAPQLETIHARGLKLENYQEVKEICEEKNITFYYDE